MISITQKLTILEKAEEIEVKEVARIENWDRLYLLIISDHVNKSVTKIHE